jgi:hypothetical protein
MRTIPDASPGPRVFIAGCAEGNLVRVGADVDDTIADDVAALVAAEPPWTDPATSAQLSSRDSQTHWAAKSVY